MVKFLQNGQEYFSQLILAIKEAKKDIYFTAYVISFSSRARREGVSEVLGELCCARERGIKVVGVINQNCNLPEVYANMNKAIEKLSAKRCEIFRMNKARILHAKLFVIDNYKIFIGSQNLSEAPRNINLESSVIIEDSNVAGQMKSWISLLTTLQDSI